MWNLLAAEAWWQNLAEGTIWIAGVLTALGIIIKFTPVRFIGKNLVTDPMREGMRKVTTEVIQGEVLEIKASLSNIHECIDRRFTDTHALIAKLQDLTEQVLVDSAGSRQRLRQLYRTLDTPIFEAGPDGHLTYINPAFSRLIGMQHTDALGEGWFEAIHADDRSRVFASWGSSVDGHHHFGSLFRIRNATTGHVFEVRAAGAPLYGANSDIVGWVGTLDPLEEQSV